MTKFRLAGFLCLLFVAPQVASERRPLRAGLDQVFDAFLDVVTPVSPVLGDSPCRRQGLLYRQAVKEGRVWALHMLDAGAKIPSGLLLNNVLQLGHFDQCLAVRHTDPALGEIEGQHCQVSVGALNRYSAPTPKEGLMLKADLQSYKRFDTLLEQRNHSAAFQMMGGSWALCVPAACSASELQLHLRSALPALPVRVNAMLCTSRADLVPVWDWHSMLALVLLSMLGALLAVGTVYDLATADTTGKPRHHLLIAFSLYNNGRLLFCADTPTNSDQHLTSLNGIRNLSMMAVVFGHCFGANLGTPLANIAEMVREHMQNMIWMPITNATLHVDTFFVMSGTLMSYSYFRQRERGTKFSARKFYLNRYLRVAPLHIVVFLIEVVLLPMGIALANAPQAKRLVVTFIEECSNFRWLNLLYISNFFDKGHFCQAAEWTLSIEMQLLLVAPLLLYPLWRKPRLGMALLGVLSVAATLYVFLIAYEHRLHVVNPLAADASPVTFLYYFYPHTRCAPWLMGLAVGALLSRRVAPSRRQAALGWCASVALGYYSMFHANVSYQHDFVPHRLHSAIYFALMRPAWSLACAWLIFACETGFGGFLHGLLGWRGWQFPSRLCFGVYMTHVMIVGTIPMMNKTMRYYYTVGGLIEFLGILVLSMFVALVLHLAIEMPCYILYANYRANATAKEQLKKVK